MKNRKFTRKITILHVPTIIITRFMHFTTMHYIVGVTGKACTGLDPVHAVCRPAPRASWLVHHYQKDLVITEFLIYLYVSKRSKKCLVWILSCREAREGIRQGGLTIKRRG